MRTGVPAEIKNHEYRVTLTPAGVHELVNRGHEVVLEQGAGAGSRITDEEFKAAGAQVISDAQTVWAGADLILKVKEPVAAEYGYLRDDLVLFTYLHLAASERCTRALLDAGTTAIAYETVRDRAETLPLLAPMSEIAGRLAPQVGSAHLMRSAGGGGVLIPGARAPKLVSNELVSRMKPGAVLVDIAVDQSGCFADSRATTHAEPTYPVHDTEFYCVANMPGAVPHTATYALTNATLPYLLRLADHGWQEALRADAGFAVGLNTHGGALTSETVGLAHGLPTTPITAVLI